MFETCFVGLKNFACLLLANGMEYFSLYQISKGSFLQIFVELLIDKLQTDTLWVDLASNK